MTVDGVLSGAWVASDEMRLLVTLVATLLGLVLLVGAHRLQRWVSRSRPLLADLIASVVLVGGAVGLAVVLLGTWDQFDAVSAIAADFDIGGAVVARAVFTFVVLLGTYILTRFVRRLLRDVLGSAVPASDHQRQVTFRVSQVLLWSVALVVILGVWVDDLSGIFIGAGVLGIVLGMAARQTLGSMLAGFVLMVSRPFEVGDWITVADHEGVVTDISIVDTRIRSLDGESVVVPNDLVGSTVVVNKSRNDRLRLEVEVSVDYETDLERARAVARESLEGLEGVLETPEPIVIAREFGDSAVVLTVRCWTDAQRAREYWRVRSQVVESIRGALADAEIEIPFPQRVLSERTAGSGTTLEHADANVDPDEQLSEPDTKPEDSTES